jgi:hypothetical protein
MVLAVRPGCVIGTRGGISATRSRLVVCALAFLAPPASAVPPELGWSLLPGGSETATSGPIEGSATDTLPGVTSSGAASADYGTLSIRTTTSVNAAQDTGGSFCLVPHCSEAEAFWSDRLVFRAPGHAANGTPGSFTATLAISGALAANLSSSWSFVTVASQYQATVEIDGDLLEQIGANCIDPPGGLSCFPAVVHVLYDPLTDKTCDQPPCDPFTNFALGPYDFTWGQPFTVEVRVRADAILDAAAQTSGTSSANANLDNTVVFVGVNALYAGPDGAGGQVPLGAATVSPASGVDWIQTVPVPEPAGWLAAAVALTPAAALGRARARRA